MQNFALTWANCLNLLFPPRCDVCGEVTPIGTAICPECMQRLPEKLFLAKCCPICGKPVQSCVCHKTPFYFSCCLSAFCYEPETRFLIEHLKTDAESPVSGQIAVLMAQAFVNGCAGKQDGIDAVTEVPMHRDNIKKRGHNQAKTLAEKLSALLNVPHIEPPLYCTADKKTQHTLTYHERIQNAQKSYERQTGVTCSKNILLIDDVMTTGATLNRCAQLLLQCGAKKVCCLTAATTLLHNNTAAKV